MCIYIVMLVIQVMTQLFQNIIFAYICNAYDLCGFVAKNALTLYFLLQKMCKLLIAHA